MKFEIPHSFLQEELYFTEKVTERAAKVLANANEVYRGIVFYVNDFQGLRMFEIQLMGLRVVPEDEKNDLILRDGVTSRDLWANPGMAEFAEFIFSGSEFEEDKSIIESLQESWEHSRTDTKYGYRLWELTAAAMNNVRKEFHHLSKLPWIIENGVEDVASSALTRILNPNGEASEYVHEVWESFQ